MFAWPGKQPAAICPDRQREARSRVVDHGGQRFLQVERFDRVGGLWRRGVFSLALVDAEFIRERRASRPVIAAHIDDAGAKVLRLG